MSLVSGDMDGGHGVAAAYINYLYTPLPQDIVSKHFFRPRDEHVSAGYANRFPRLELFTIDDVFGGWQKHRKCISQGWNFRADPEQLKVILYRRYLYHWLILDSLIFFRFLLFECRDLYYQWELAKPASLASAFTLHIDKLILLFNAAYYRRLARLTLMKELSMQPDQPATQIPNQYQLSGKHLHVTYSTTSFDGKPRFTYQDRQQTLSFSGEEIRSVETEVGILVSVTIRMTVDTGGTTFSILLPHVQIPGEQTVPVKTFGITTIHKFSVISISGQRDFYTVTRLSGSASLVFF